MNITPIIFHTFLSPYKTNEKECFPGTLFHLFIFHHQYKKMESVNNRFQFFIFVVFFHSLRNLFYQLEDTTFDNEIHDQK